MCKQNNHKYHVIIQIYIYIYNYNLLLSLTITRLLWVVVLLGYYVIILIYTQIILDIKNK